MSQTVNVDVTYLEHQDELLEWLEEDADIYVLTKGRRHGWTHFLIQFIFDVLVLGKQVEAVLWIDTVNGNIDRYFEQFMLPLLRQIPKKCWRWRSQMKRLNVLNTFVDFRSSDQPQRLEGFGYDYIIINEAGIVLFDRTLWENTLVPMTWSNPNAKIIAGGVPKGKKGKKDNENRQHVFHELYERATNGEDGFTLLERTTFDNTSLSKKQLRKEEARWDPLMIRQEMYGEFIDKTGLLWTYCFGDQHKVNVVDDLEGPIYLDFDFNINPFTCLISQHHEEKGIKCIDFIDEIYMKQNEIVNDKTYIENICQRVKDKYPGRYYLISGDASSNKGDVNLAVHVTAWKQILKYLEVGESQLFLPSKNPPLERSQEICNAMLSKPELIKIRVHPVNCKNLVDDCEECKCADDGTIIKNDGWRSHMLDNFRYHLNTWFHDFIDKMD